MPCTFYPFVGTDLSDILMLGARFNSICGINVFDVMFRPLSNGQRGEVYRDRVAVILESSENKTDEGIRDEKTHGAICKTFSILDSRYILHT